MARKLKGIRVKNGKYQVFVRVRPGPGGFKSTTFPLSTPVSEMREWQDDMRDKFGTEPAVDGSFAADVQKYVERVKAMPTIGQRTAHLAIWVKELGRDRPRHSITSEEIDIVLQDWLEELAPATVRKRRTALQSFFVKMDGKKSRRVNPVKGSDNPKPPKPEARALDYLLIERALACMPEFRDVKKGEVRPLSLARVRAAVIAYTGIPPGLLQQVQPSDLSLPAATVRIEARSKGEGVEARTLPLTKEGLAAFRTFHAANAYGEFAIESVNRAFKRGCKKAGLDPRTVHLYDLRHSFLTEVYRVTRDEATVGRLGLHVEGSTATARYTKGANRSVDMAATAAFSAALATQRRGALKAAPGPAAAKKLPRKVAQTKGRPSKVSEPRHLRRIS